MCSAPVLQVVMAALARGTHPRKHLTVSGALLTKPGRAGTSICLVVSPGGARRAGPSGEPELEYDLIESALVPLVPAEAGTRCFGQELDSLLSRGRAENVFNACGSSSSIAG